MVESRSGMLLELSNPPERRGASKQNARRLLRSGEEGRAPGASDRDNGFCRPGVRVAGSDRGVAVEGQPSRGRRPARAARGALKALPRMGRVPGGRRSPSQSIQAIPASRNRRKETETQIPRIFRWTFLTPPTWNVMGIDRRGRHVNAVGVLDSYPKRWIATPGYRKSGLIYIYI
jgi:hypothetical protein